MSAVNAVRRWYTRARHAADVCRVYRDPLVRVRDYLGRVPHGEVREVRLRNRLRVRARLGTSDLAIVDEVFGHGVYDRALRALRPGAAVLDIGAQAGVFALAAAARGASVLCCEPVRENAALLWDNVRLNGFEDRVTVRPVAVAPTAGTMMLYVVDGDTGGATSFPAIHPLWLRDGRMRAVEVECVTLEALLGARPGEAWDCVKLDCEGGEYAILGAASAEALGGIRTLILEYHPNGDVAALARRLEALGFEVEVLGRPAILWATSRRATGVRP